MQIPERKSAILAGLAIAWGGTVLLSNPPVTGVLGDPARPWLLLAGIALYWVLAASVIAIVLFWEKQPLRSLWLQPFSFRSIAWGFLLVVLHYAVFFPAGEWVRRSAGLPGFSAGMEQIMSFPLWYRVCAVVGAGVVEETLLRGFTVTRLIVLTRSVWLAAVLALVAFGALHIPVWGFGFVLGGLISGAAAMIFFVWKRDLLALIVFHTITDAIGLVIAPAFSDWWKDPSLS